MPQSSGWLPTALDVVTQTAGIGWRQELTKNGKTRIRFGKSIHTQRTLPILVGGLTSPDADPTAELPDIPTVWTKPGHRAAEPDTLFSHLLARREQSVFDCPHCKEHIVIEHAPRAPKCPKCNQAFQARWNYCPNDGTKRPASAGTWQFCPKCGKRVSDH